MRERSHGHPLLEGQWQRSSDGDRFVRKVQNTYIFFRGQRVARVDSTGAVHYYFSDHLGTHAVVENATGTACEQDVDYYPYGGEQNDYCSTPVAQNYKFNGKERDVESGLDNFGTRYNTSNVGRFMTPDWAAKPVNVPYAHFGNPQSLNLYAYAQNNPTTLGDPDGHSSTGDMIFRTSNYGTAITISPAVLFSEQTSANGLNAWNAAVEAQKEKDAQNAKAPQTSASAQNVAQSKDPNKVAKGAAEFVGGAVLTGIAIAAGGWAGGPLLRHDHNAIR